MNKDKKEDYVVSNSGRDNTINRKNYDIGVDEETERTYQDTIPNKDTLYQKTITEQANNNANNSDNALNNDNYYDLLKNQSYKTLLNSEIQAGIAKDQALKYTQNQLNASGYGTQGLSESTRAGLYNNYINALNNAQANYDQNMLDISKEQRQENNDVFESFTTLMDSAESSDDLNKLLNAYQLKEENGRLSGDFYNSLDGNSQRQLDYLYKLYKNRLESEENAQNVSTFIDTYKKNDGASSYNATTYSGFDRATIEALFKDSNLSKLQNGDTIAVIKDMRINYLVYNNGNLIPISQDGFNRSQSQYWYAKDYGLKRTQEQLKSSAEIRVKNIK